MGEVFDTVNMNLIFLALGLVLFVTVSVSHQVFISGT